MDPSTNVEFFTNAKNFNIRNGQFRTIGGNSYTGYHPPPASPAQKRPAISSRTSYFSKASDFEIGGGEFAAIEGDSVDIIPSFDASRPSLNDEYYDPDLNGSVHPQTFNGQLGLDVPQKPSSREPAEVIAQIIDHNSASAEEGQETANMAPRSVDVAQATIVSDDRHTSSSLPGIPYPDYTDHGTPPQEHTSLAIGDVEPALLAPPMSSTQSKSPEPIPTGDERGVPATHMQDLGDVVQPAEPHSRSEGRDHPDVSSRGASAEMDIHGSGMQSPEGVRTSETNPPSRLRRRMSPTRSHLC